LHWGCSAKLTLTGAPVTEGTATRVYARINEDGTLKSATYSGRIASRANFGWRGYVFSTEALKDEVE
jgi:hypothetical protein